ncbi:putative two-component system response regulator [Methylomagnum ishizawai]|uniref:Putative two-component system response regulator n=1 Tax=Methylomagnum ishizawai TaxID=1760988 RepID=A0A1Y6D7Z6_9GAMM|nr:two-component system response regulator [Methylomagnum ishizawai]SMF95945.1 putative two-component system response regulator [Methylomagnum ishizawai]
MDKQRTPDCFDATLLVVDDGPENLTVMGDLLRPFYRVRVANSGQRALAVVATPPTPDLILLDIMMPGMDGYTVLAQLRDHPSFHDIPVIFVTALDTPEDEERGLALGAVDYITKPLRPAVVLARVRAHLELKRARDGLRDQADYLEAQVARCLSENQAIQEAGIQALARLVEIRDQETGAHLRRTQEYVRVLARRLLGHPRFAGILDERVIEVMAKSALLHDIGKVGIPDHILFKPGRLTPEEQAVMRTHSNLGGDAIAEVLGRVERSLEFLGLAQEIARHHHEQWDGGGYPDGLAGEAIPVSARLIALADVFDALTSERVYKAGLSFAEARAVIARERGRHFDPDIVDAFLEVFDEFQRIAQRHADPELCGQSGEG